MTQLQEEWAEQYRRELEKQSSARASQVESLLFAGDYDAIREWIDQWQQEDETPDSLRSRYRKVRSQLRKERHRQHQRQLYGSVIDRITGKST
jgi:exonuclease III